jgi:hypothetical protein
VKQETKININIGDKGKGKRKYVRRQAKKESQQAQPNIITISNPPAVSTTYQLPIYYQQKQEPTPFLANTEPTVQIPVSHSPVKNQIPITYKNVPVDPTQLSGQVPASFIPEEAPALVKTGGDISSLRREFTTYTPPATDVEVGGAYLTEVEAVAVKPRKKYTYKPETIQRREALRKMREEAGIPLQNTPPNPETSMQNLVPSGMSNTEFLNKNIMALEKYSKEASSARQQQEGLIEEMKLKEATIKNKTMKNRQLSQSPSAVYQRERRQKLKAQKK